jgi:hypothetical protein
MTATVAPMLFSDRVLPPLVDVGKAIYISGSTSQLPTCLLNKYRSSFCTGSNIGTSNGSSYCTYSAPFDVLINTRFDGSQLFNPANAPDDRRVEPL